ncbi:MAG TPA: sulfatase [Anaerolineales bacterium]|nr:sulfatase [Anaerolineales bacterium]
MKRKVTSIFQFTVALLMLLSTSGCRLPFIKDERPNFLIIVSDDQRFDTMEYMPNTQQLIFDQGVTYTNGFITTPLCCPSRASILTGMYAHNHGVLDNDNKLKHTTFMEIMHKEGYNTGLVGKYLNSWKGEKRPEYDFWVSYFKGETRYYRPTLNVNGEWFRFEDQYITYILGNYAVEFIREASNKKKPFVLIFTPNAPHEPVTPANEDLHLLDDLPPYRPPSFNEDDISDKPEWLASQPLLSKEEIQANDEFRKNQLLTLISLDRTIKRIMDELKVNEELDNTFVLFISDNGKFWGEHRITSKNGIYDEASRVPFAVRYPALVPTPYIDEEHVVANIDIAPTVLDLAGIPIPDSMDGLSLVSLLSGDMSWREGILLEGWPPRGTYSVVHTKRYVYAETVNQKSEFYDLQIDPYQMENLIDDPAYQALIEQHRELLSRINIQKNVPTVTP